jgi:glycosyltransferase involved in cell wall biosynthesis
VRISQARGEIARMTRRGLKILMLLENQSYPRDPRVRHEAAALHEHGHKVTILAPRAQGEKRTETIDGVRVYRYWRPRTGAHLPGYVMEYSSALLAMFALSVVIATREGFDVIHAHNPPDALVLVGIAWRFFGKRFVFDQHDLSPELFVVRFSRRPRGPGHRLLLLFERLSCRVADLVITTNGSYRRLLIDRHGLDPDDVVVVRNGPALARLAKRPPESGGVGRRLVYVGLMGVQDGIEHLLHAVKYILVDFGRSDVECVLAGDGDARPKLETLVRTLGIEEHVTFVGFLETPEILDLLASADVCVVPDPSNEYNDRSTMVKLMEYMAAGRAIAAFDLPEHRVTAASAALYARPNDDMELATAIVRLLDDPMRRRRMSIVGMERVRRSLAWEHSIPPLVKAYSSLADAVVGSTADRQKHRACPNSKE